MISKEFGQSSPDLKSWVARQTARTRQTFGVLVCKCGVHPSQVRQRKKQLLAGETDLSSRNGTKLQQV